MKENFTKFTCNSCGKVEVMSALTGFPYDKGWCYLFNFSGKVKMQYEHRRIDRSTGVYIGRFEEKDKHFCCETCRFAFIIETIMNTKKILATEDRENFIRALLVALDAETSKMCYIKPDSGKLTDENYRGLKE